MTAIVFPSVVVSIGLFMFFQELARNSLSRFTMNLMRGEKHLCMLYRYNEYVKGLIHDLLRSQTLNKKF